MIEVKDKKDCCGCWGCKNVCPKQCIKMKEDEEGFCYPHIDYSLCIDCGLCEKVCPIIQKHEIEPFPQKAYVVQHKNLRILKESTSGGFFTALANYILLKGGVVCGCHLDENFAAEHEFVETSDKLCHFRNSKYVQSIIGNTYQEVKAFLQDDRYVLFSGTPCQLEGLFNYLHKPYSKLYTVDVVCRAVPSPMILRKYLEMQQRVRGDLRTVMFRDKYHGYKYSSMSLFTNGGNDYHEGIDTDVYLRSFFSGVNIRPSCTKCRFRSRYRRTDFTIWDCFNIDEFSKELDNDQGATRVLCHSERSCNIIKELVDDLKIVEVASDKAVYGVKEMISGPVFHIKRDGFFADINNPHYTTEQVFQKYFPITLRHRFEKQIRLWSSRLGLYKSLKKVFKAIIRNNEISR